MAKKGKTIKPFVTKKGVKYINDPDNPGKPLLDNEGNPILFEEKKEEEVKSPPVTGQPIP